MEWAAGTTFPISVDVALDLSHPKSTWVRPLGERGTSLAHPFISDAFIVVSKFLSQSHCESEPGSYPPRRPSSRNPNGKKGHHAKCRVPNHATGPAKQTRTTPQTPRSISQPYIHMDSYMASPSRGSWAIWEWRTSTSHQPGIPVLKILKIN